MLLIQARQSRKWNDIDDTSTHRKLYVCFSSIFLYLWYTFTLTLMPIIQDPDRAYLPVCLHRVTFSIVTAVYSTNIYLPSERSLIFVVFHLSLAHYYKHHSDLNTIMKNKSDKTFVGWFGSMGKTLACASGGRGFDPHRRTAESSVGSRWDAIKVVSVSPSPAPRAWYNCSILNTVKSTRVSLRPLILNGFDWHR